MSNSKLKNIILLILLALNLFLLGALLSDRTQTAAIHQEAWESLLTSLENSGLNVSDSLNDRLATPKIYTIRRSAVTEQSMMEKIFGSVTVEELGGNILFYSSNRGQASLRGTGETNLLLASDTWSTGRDAAKAAQRLLERMGLSVSEKHVQLDSDAKCCTLYCSWRGHSVYNARLTLYYNDRYFDMITGIRVFDEVTGENSSGVMDELTAITRFLEIINEGNWNCTSLLDLDVGYVQTVTVSGESTLTPVWRFDTDAGPLYLNAVSGKVETL